MVEFLEFALKRNGLANGIVKGAGIILHDSVIFLEQQCIYIRLCYYRFQVWKIAQYLCYETLYVGAT